MLSLECCHSEWSEDMKPFPLLSFVVLTCLMTKADAGIIVSFSPTIPSPLVAGGSGQVDVLIASDTGTDLLDQYLASVVLSPVGGPLGGLVFSPFQSETFLTDSSYVFFNRSQSVNLGAPAGTVNFSGDVYSAYDATDDGSGPPPAPGLQDPIFVPTVGNEALLFRLDLDALAAGTYEIDLDPLSQFVDENGFDIFFASTSGFLTVNPAPAAVPEPGSILLLSVGTMVAAVRYRRCKQASESIA
ncbi:MAG: PEP-CTERM sorting domain-containing protein [Planctomycetaceae bacterium]